MLIETSLLVAIPMLLILNMLSNYFKKQKFKKLEKEMRGRGIDEDAILIARHFLTK